MSASLVAVAVLAGCSKDQLSTGYLPTERNLTDKVNPMIDLWNWSWIAALAVGSIVWGLILFSCVAYRRRRATDPLPPQVQYNVPLEVMYTIVPVIMIGVMFWFTAKDQAFIEARAEKPDVKIQVIAKQWAWDFNYTDANVHQSTQQVRLSDHKGPGEPPLPKLYLPVNKNVEVTINSRDVIHSFWIPAFLYKKDAIPSHTNYMTVTPQKEGTYRGLCAELCGEYHSEMLFDLEVVSQARFDEEMKKLRDNGQTGLLGLDLSRQGPAPTERPRGNEGGHG